jgi:hypothetical protein
MNDLDLIAARLAGLGQAALAVAAQLEESRGCIDLPPERARQVLADLNHLAGELAAIGDVLGAVRPGMSPRPSGRRRLWESGARVFQGPQDGAVAGSPRAPCPRSAFRGGVRAYRLAGRCPGPPEVPRRFSGTGRSGALDKPPTGETERRGESERT